MVYNYHMEKSLQLRLQSKKAKPRVLALVQSKGVVTSGDIVAALKISRQAAAKHLRELVAANKLSKSGSTKQARYMSLAPGRKKSGPAVTKFCSRHSLKRLQEDVVLREIELKTGLQKKLSPKAFRIVVYAFTEMLNNAIDHSKGKFSFVQVAFKGLEFQFEIQDDGIGVFESIRRKFALKNHFESVEHLLKGKQTTDPQRHSGQGIFFTSKIADCFSLESAKTKLVMDNRLQDVFLNDVPFCKGTRVVFVLKAKSRKDLKALFDAYSDRELEFDKTKIIVRLSEKDGENVSRSQARRLLFGLDKFKRIVFDFKKIRGIGQGFSDEIFRVFQQSHPRITLEIQNAIPAVEFMIRRAQKDVNE